MKNKNKVGNETLLTVLTPGLGGSASHFADFKDSLDNYYYVTDKNNIVNCLCQKAKNKVRILYAKTNLSKAKDVTQYFIDDYRDDEIKHTIVLYETEDAYESNDLSYQEFDEVISRVVYDIKKSNNDILPKINLIGHSRGGLINLLYALDHPRMVNQIFSIGTPYIGSSIAKIDVELNDCNIGSKGQDKNGEIDIVNEELYISYKNRWNKNIELYKNIDVYAIAGETTYELLSDIIKRDETIDYVSEETNENIKLCKIVSSMIAGMLDAFSYLSILTEFNKDNWNTYVFRIQSLLEEYNSQYAQIVPSFLNTFINESEYKNIKKD